MAANGKTGGECTNPADPCSFKCAISRISAGGAAMLAVALSAVGEEVVIEVSAPLLDPGDLRTGQHLTFAAYLVGITNPGTNVAGKVKLTGERIQLYGFPNRGRITVDPKLNLVIAVEALQIAGLDSDEPVIAGTVTLGDSEISRMEVNQPLLFARCIRFGTVIIASRVSLTPGDSTGNSATSTCDKRIFVESLVVEDRLDLKGVYAMLEVTSTYSADAGHTVTVNDDIRSSDGTLVLSLTGYRDVDFEEEGDDAGLVLDYDAAECFSVGGSGSMELDIELRTASCVEISLSETGGGGESVLHGGTLRFLEAVESDGSIRTMGAARTEFRGTVSLSGDLSIDGQLPGADLQDVVFPLWRNWFGGAPPDGDSLDVSVGYDNVLDVPLFSIGTYEDNVSTLETSRIEGDLAVRNIRLQVLPSYNSSLPNTTYVFDPCQSGFFVHHGARGSQCWPTITGSVTTTTRNDSPHPVDGLRVGGYFYAGGELGPNGGEDLEVLIGVLGAVIRSC